MPKKTGKGMLERGAHIVRRKAFDPGGDPYLNKEAPADMALCRRCGAVYHEKRWYGRDELPGKLSERPNTGLVLCPGCQKVKDRFAGGYLLIEGRFVEEHADEIMNAIENKKDLQSRINPLEQIVDIRRAGARIEVETTTDKLAQRIGQIIRKAFGGELTCKWSEDTKLARLIWTRD